MAVMAGPPANILVDSAPLLAPGLQARVGGAPPFVPIPPSGVLQYAYLYKLALGIFNLIPLPPLDGRHFLPYLLPRGSWTLLRRLEQYGPLILLLLVLSGATGYVIGPIFAGMDALYRVLLRLII